MNVRPEEEPAPAEKTVPLPAQTAEPSTAEPPAAGAPGVETPGAEAPTAEPPAAEAPAAEPPAPEPPVPAARTGFRMTRRRWVAVVVAGAVVLAGAGLGAAQFVKSPAQAAADSKAPPPDVLEAPVEKRVLRQNIVVRGTAGASRTSEIAPATAGGADGAEPIVTKLPLKAGDTVREGTVLMEVSGRPVIALRGATPVYRDLKPGTSGDDVRQLQAALRSLGHGTGGDTSGSFGAGTKSALSALYRALGYDPRPATDDDGEALQGAADAVLAARRALEDARTAAAQASTAPTTGTGDSRDQDDGKEQGGGADKGGGTEPGTSPAPDPSVPTDPGPQKPGASAQGERGALVGGPAAADDPSARRAVVRAQEDLARAEERYDDAKAKSGPMLPAAEVVYLTAFPARVGTVSAAVGAHVNGTAMTVSSGELLVTSYLQDNQKGLVRTGAKAEVVDENSGRTYKATVSGVDSQRAEDAARGAGGNGGDGAAGGGEDGNDPSQDGGSGGEAQATGYRMTVQTTKKLPAALAGADLRVSIQAGATDGPVLVVPVTAVSAGADGRRAVTVVRASGAQTRVEVRTGAQADGYVEVRPAGGQKLVEGDRVVTGASRAGGGS
ncbi:peptidoglycan-binding protein [Streptomyces sp. GZWMJZ-114]|uniref:peptidoglycan-binding protein n=1 Tax=Streptomyces sp. GZWMJZ-114 TaxID=2494734 RepID=UPI001010FD42|nr:peptidoglycan-binding protein [Streptomyces sp. GZWMJZ-114]